MGIGQITAQEETVRQSVLRKLWNYVDENFHKFSEPNKIKIVISLCSRSMPQIIEGNYQIQKMDKIKIEDKPLEYKIGRN